MDETTQAKYHNSHEEIDGNASFILIHPANGFSFPPFYF
jgi:hypothetical protein